MENIRPNGRNCFSNKRQELLQQQTAGIASATDMILKEDWKIQKRSRMKRL
jgi:hypothetical protein